MGAIFIPTLFDVGTRANQWREAEADGKTKREIGKKLEVVFKMKSKIMVGIYLLFMASTVFATNRYVSLVGNNNSPYTNWVDAATNIQSAVNASFAGDTVWISNGVYSLSAPVTSAVSFSIIGTGGVVTVDGNNLVPCFVFALNKTNNLSNLTITKGYNSSTNSGNGGGVYLANGTIQDCIFSNNVATNNGGGLYLYFGVNGVIQRCDFYGNNSTLGFGGGLYLYAINSTVVVDNCSFRSNTIYKYSGSGGGGAINIEAGSGKRVLITNCVFESNVSTGQCPGGAVYMGAGDYVTHCSFNSNSVLYYGYGGAIRNGGGTVSNCFISNNVSFSPGGYAGAIWLFNGEVKNCVIANNRAESYGGGMILKGDGKVENCIIEGNRSVSYGGGLEWLDGTTNSYIRNCLIRNNFAQANGGGITIGVGSVLGTISGCTIVSNKANGGYGGGLYNQNTATANQSSMENCVVYYNAGVVNASNYYLATNSMYFTNCLVSPAPTGYQANIFVNVQTNSPQFVDWLSSDYHLANGSPCINAGVNRGWMTGTFDLDGRRRIDGFSGLVDLGCYEHIFKGTMFTIR